MAILADRNTRLIVQGITGREGDFHARLPERAKPGFDDLGEHQLKGKNQLVRLFGLK